MLSKILTYSLLGIEALAVEVEVDVSHAAEGKVFLVGLPEAAVKESLHRCDRAIANSGYERANDRVVINLAPAELPKNAASFDLPITLGLLASSGQFGSDRFDQYAVVGELSLEGTTRPVKGALSMAMSVSAAKKTKAGKRLRGLVVPVQNAPEAAVLEDIEVIPVGSLSEAIGFFSGQLDIAPAPHKISEIFAAQGKYDDDFGDVRGQEMAKRAITIAAAGKHNLLMVAPVSGTPLTGQSRR